MPGVSVAQVSLDSRLRRNDGNTKIWSRDSALPIYPNLPLTSFQRKLESSATQPGTAKAALDSRLRGNDRRRSAVSRLLPALLLFLSFFSGCSAPPALYQHSGMTMGTSWHVSLLTADGGTAGKAEKTIETVLGRIDSRMSTWKTASEISRFNRSRETAPFPVSKETADLVARALEISRETGGAFDVTVAPLVDAWGFGPRDETAPPDAAAIEALRAETGWRMLHAETSPPALRKDRPAIQCDLSAVAKGYAADAVAEALEDLGITRYMAEIGGEVRTGGLKADASRWRIGIEKPVTESRTLQEAVPLTGMAMATSGDYRNYRDAGGKRYSHTIDPRTGRPVTHTLASVSVLRRRCADADALATALMVMGPEKGYEFAFTRQIGALFISHNGRGGFTVRRTPFFPASVQP
jgi:FAD:protein FMN transferase